VFASLDFFWHFFMVKTRLESRPCKLVSRHSSTIFSIGLGRAIIAFFLCGGVFSSQADTHFVDIGNTNIVPPYTNWVDAVTNIQDAISMASEGDTVLVANGTYVLTNTITLAKGIRLFSVNGPTKTILDGNNTTRCVRVSHSNAVVDGFTITRGKTTDWDGSGAGARLERGLVQNCHIVSNYVAYTPGIKGGGVFCNGGGTVRNCLIEGNTVNGLGGSTAYGGGLGCQAGGLVENCTIVNNTAFGGTGLGATASGLYLQSGGTARNTIIYFNNGGFNTLAKGTGPAVEYCCTTPIVTGNHIITSDPRFLDWNERDYRLHKTSPCINFGTNQVWMSSSTDLRGKQRVMDVIVDLGAMECDVPDSLAVDIRSSPRRQGVAPLNVAFSADVLGTNTAELYYRWDFDGDGRPDAEGPRLDYLPYVYTQAGCYSVSLTVSNAAGEVAQVVKPDFLSISAEPLSCNFSATPLFGNEPLLTRLRATVQGANQTGIDYAWDFDNDGITDSHGSELHDFSRLYPTSGVYSISLTVSNTAGEVAHCTRLQYLRVGSGIAYVAPAGQDIPPYTNWETAARTVSAAVSAARDGMMVLVTNGTYILNATINVTNAITLKSVNGALSTALDGNATQPVIRLGCSNAVLDGFTLVHGNSASGHGGGAYLVAGTIIQNCRIETNHAGGHGGGVFLEQGALVQHCTIKGNSAVGQGGGAILYYGGELRNCLVDGNSAYGGGGGRCWGGGLIQNCTFVNNMAPWGAGGLYCDQEGALVRDSIIFFNGVDGKSNFASEGNVKITHCLTTPQATPDVWANVNMTNAPIFIDAAHGNYHLQAGSPGIDQASFFNSDDDDMEGTPRPLDGDDNGVAVADIGIYEFVHPTTDTDDDGATDSDEIFSGTDPRKASSYLQITGTAKDSSNGIVIRWTSIDGKSYTLGVSTKLEQGFTVLTNHIPASPPENIHTNTVPDLSTKFYRIQVE